MENIPTIYQYDEAIKNVAIFLLKHGKNVPQISSTAEIVEKTKFEYSGAFLKKKMPINTFIKIELNGVEYGLIYMYVNTLISVNYEFKVVEWANAKNSKELTDFEYKNNSKIERFVVKVVFGLLIVIACYVLINSFY